MGRTACTEPQCLYKGDLYLYFYQPDTPKINSIVGLPVQTHISSIEWISGSTVWHTSSSKWRVLGSN